MANAIQYLLCILKCVILLNGNLVIQQAVTYITETRYHLEVNTNLLATTFLICLTPTDSFNVYGLIYEQLVIFSLVTANI